MKKYLAIVLTAALLLCAAPLAGFTAVDLPEMDFGHLYPFAHAVELVDSGNYGNYLTCTLNSDGLLTFSGSGKMQNYDLYDSPWYNNSSIQTVIIQNGVTSIGSNVFCDCAGLTAVTIPDSVTSIENGAFFGCAGLTSMTIPDSVTSIGNSAFFGCTNLTAVTIPDSVTSIGDFAFCGCKGLTEVTIPDSVTSIGVGAFEGCTDLKSVTIGCGLTSIRGSAFSDCTEIETLTVSTGNPIYYSQSNCIIEKSTKMMIAGCKTSMIPTDGSVTSIGGYAFDGCTGLTAITIPDSVTSIGDSAFSGCTGLTAVTIPYSVTNIGSSAFDGCTGMIAVTIPDSVTNIGYGMFSGCTSLTAVTIPDSVTDICDWAFSGCTHLTAVTIPDSVTSIGNRSFFYCTGLTEVTIGNSVTSIGNSTFSDCTGLTAVTIPDSVTSIGDFAFCGCTGLTAVTIPDSVTSIGSSAFSICTSLTAVTIPDSVTNIGSSVFSICTGIVTMTVSTGNPVYYSQNNCIIEKNTKTLIAGCKTSKIPTDGSVISIGEVAFYGCTGLTKVTIPDSVTSIEKFAFCGCTGLTAVTIPDNVTSIRDIAFSDCTNLISIIIPQSVTEIGWEAIPKYTVIYGSIGSYAQQWAEDNNRAFVPISEAAVTLNVPEVVNEPTVNVYGFANPGADVVCAVNGTETVTVQASASGRWNAAIPLTGAKDGDSFTIKAAVTVDGKTAEQTAAVTYKPDAIVFEELTLNHSCYTVTFKGERLGVSVPNFTFVPGKPLAFKIKVSNSDRIDKLYIVSTKDGDSRQMALTYDEANGYWFANGYFDNAEQNYVPGVFTFKGVDKDGKAFDCGVTIRINFLIDPSGYAYEAVQSNKLEGVTAAVYYKDAEGHELLWNAETADQLNPVATLADGAFAWVVPEGKWQVRLTKDGYEEARSEWMDVPPEHTNVYIAMVSQNAPEAAYCNVYADRAEITFSQYMSIDSVNADNVKFDDYTGKITPLDKTEAAAGSGVFYAKAFAFTPDKAFAGEISVTISGVKNYADRELASPYTATFTVAAEPKNLTATREVSVAYGKTAKIEVSAENAAGKTVSVSCDSAGVTLSDKTLTLDEAGKAKLSVTGEMPGAANLTFALDGTALTASVKVAVEVPGIPAEPDQPAEPEIPEYTPGDVDGDGEVTSGDARLALRASVQLEKYEPGTAAFLAADTDKNGVIEASDARTILRVSVKLESF